MSGLNRFAWGLFVSAVSVAGCDPATAEPDPQADDAEFRTFISPADMGGGDGPECQLGLQDCPAGEKCNPYATSGWFKDYRCVAVSENPRAPGESCEIAGIVTSGLDDCERGSYCVSPDGASLQGTCVSHQVGSQTRTLCVDPFTTPSIGADSVLTPCPARCNPLAPDCGPDQGCIPARLEDRFVCVPIAVESPTPLQEECSFDFECEAGAACINADMLPECTGAACCASFCNTGVPSCPGSTTCESWYAADQAPPGLADLGLCR